MSLAEAFRIWVGQAKLGLVIAAGVLVLVGLVLGIRWLHRKWKGAR